VDITPAGREAGHQVCAIIHATETAWMRVLRAEELATCIGLLRRVRDGISAAPEA